MTSNLYLDAAMVAAFPEPGRVTEPLSSGSEPCTDGDCEHRSWGLHGEIDPPERDAR